MTPTICRCPVSKNNPDKSEEREPYVDVGVISALLGVDESTVRRWSSAKRLPKGSTAKVGGVWRYRISVIERWLEAGGELSETEDG